MPDWQMPGGDLRDASVRAAKIDLSDTFDFRTPSGIVRVPYPVVAGDAASKDYVDDLIGASAPVEVVEVNANIVINGGAALPTIDGYAVQDGDRVLLNGQTTGSENGIWIAHSIGTAWERPDDFATGQHAGGRSVWVKQGTLHADTQWICVTDPPNDVIDTNALVFNQKTVDVVRVTTTNPTVNDDQTKGYERGDLWFNYQEETFWQLADPSTGAANWWVIGTRIHRAPMGFEYPCDDTITTITWNDGTTTFTISPVGATFNIWNKGKKYTFSSPQTLVGDGTDFTIAEGVWYFYFDATGVLKASQTPWDFSQHAPVALIYWDATNSKAIVFADERHGTSMTWGTHESIHETVGPRWASGLGLTGTVGGTGNNESDAQVDIDDGTIYDENLKIEIQDGAAGRFTQELSPIAYIPVLYLDGATPVWRRKTATAFPVKEGAVRIQYNLDTAGTWSTPDANQIYHVAMWIFGTNDYGDPVFAVLGQRQDITLANARANNLLENLVIPSLPIAEIKPLYRLIFQTNSAYTNTPHARLMDIVDMREVSLKPKSSFHAQPHSVLSDRDVHPSHTGESINFTDRQQVLYVGKHGSDTDEIYDGKDPEHPFLTIGAAITAAGTPANEAAAVTIEVLDDGEYHQNLTVPSYVNIHAPHATIKGYHTFGACRIVARRLINDGNLWIIYKNTAGTLCVEAQEIWSDASSSELIFHTGDPVGDLYVRVGKITSSAAGVMVLNGSANVHVDIDEIAGPGGSAKTILVGANCSLYGRIGRITGSIGLDVFGKAYLSIASLVCTTSYGARTGSTIRLLIAELSGTPVLESGSDLRITRARRNNLIATSDPTVNDDTDEGYEPGSRWLNTSTQLLFVCISSASGAAVWLKASNLAHLQPYLVGPVGLAPYQTIQSAITAAPEGYSIYVLPGTYNENLTFKKGQMLVAVLKADDIAFAGLTVTVDGNHSMANDSGSSTSIAFWGINFSTTTGVVIALSGADNINVTALACKFVAVDANMFTFAGAGLKSITCVECAISSIALPLCTLATGCTLSLRASSALASGSDLVDLTGGTFTAHGEYDSLVQLYGRIHLVSGTSVIKLERYTFATGAPQVQCDGSATASSFYFDCYLGDHSTKITIAGANASTFKEAPVVGAESTMRYDGSIWQVIKNNITAGSPGVNDDDTQGYAIWSQWIDTTGPDAYVCLDASTGAAVWKKTTP